MTHGPVEGDFAIVGIRVMSSNMPGSWRGTASCSESCSIRRLGTEVMVTVS